MVAGRSASTAEVLGELLPGAEIEISRHRDRDAIGVATLDVDAQAAVRGGVPLRDGGADALQASRSRADARRLSSSPALSLDARVAARMATARVSIALTVLEGLGLFTYVALTWSEPHRALGALLAAVACVLGAGLTVAPLELLLSDRWVSVTWLAWSLTLVVATAVGVAIDAEPEARWSSCSHCF